MKPWMTVRAQQHHHSFDGWQEETGSSARV
jgi:hypothetical protein